MNDTDFKNLLLKTAFCCMASDGHIDPSEIEAINNLCLQSDLFEDINYKAEISDQANLLNARGKDFVTEFLDSLSLIQLSEKQHLEIVEFAFKTIEADDEIHYSEIKFFKAIRAKLNIPKELILQNFPGKDDFVEDDIITDASISKTITESFINLGDLNIVIE